VTWPPYLRWRRDIYRFYGLSTYIGGGWSSWEDLMLAISMGFSETVLGGLILKGNWDGSWVACSFSGNFLIRYLSFSSRRIFCSSEPPGNWVRRLALIFFLPVWIFLSRVWLLPGKRVFRWKFRSIVDYANEMRGRYFVIYTLAGLPRLIFKSPEFWTMTIVLPRLT
jgi:hypothetical protein